MDDEILDIVEKHEKWREKECLNLIPSENVMSPAVRRIISSDFGHRYTARDCFYMGTQFTDEIEQYGEKLARELFRVDTADLRPLSGHIADMIFLATYTKPNDTIMCIAPDVGGYPGMWNPGLARLLRVKAAPFPFSKHDMNIRVKEAKQAMEQIKPTIVIFGASFITFPYPVKELSQIARENGAIVGYDGSHVLGLIAGEQFQDPLREGACTLFGSTHKSFFGPQGGIILADKEHGETMKKAIFPTFVDNAHWNRIAALTLALAETKKFGKAYAKQVINNSRSLAKALSDYGFPVSCQHLGFTQSHQVLLEYEDYGKGKIFAEKLQDANVIVDCGVRIGTCEVTRRGMREGEMLKIAELIKKKAMDGESSEKIRKEVAKLCSEFHKVEYCFAE